MHDRIQRYHRMDFLIEALTAEVGLIELWELGS